MTSNDVAKEAAATLCPHPAWPVAGPGVAAELNKACPITKSAEGRDISSCPATDAWLAKLKKYKQQVEVAP